MRNFLRFILRFANLILFLALEVFCFVLIARTNTLQGNDVLNSANTVTGFIYQKQNDLTYYFGLGKMNDSLLRENARLHTLIAAKGYSTDILRDSTVIQKTVSNDSTHTVQYAHYIYRTAKVINNSVAQENNFITINRGADYGIKKDMPVISGTGVVGKVVHVSAHFATVLSILSDLQPVSAKLKDGTTGLVQWRYEKTNRSPDVLYMPDIAPEIPLHKGDSVYTTSYSFAPDVLVGTVTDVYIFKKTNKRILYIRPATNFRNMQYVYVLENTLLTEQRALEQQNVPASPDPKKKPKR